MNVPITSATAELEVRKSRFIGGAGSFHRSDSIKQVVSELRARHAGCNHVVYAYAVGDSGDNHGMSDDREPKGTAGRPVLEVVRGSGVTNLLITVVRFFGGTKLGTGGLVRAYTEVAQLALAGLRTEELIERVPFEFRVPYALYEPVIRLIRELSGTIEVPRFEETVALSGTADISPKEPRLSTLATVPLRNLSATSVLKN